MEENYKDQIENIRNILAPYKAHIKRPAKGIIPYDYVVPSGYYENYWDWDGFFMTVALSSEISSEAIYLRNWALNFIVSAKTNGRIVGCMSPAEWDERLHQIKPFLGQGVYLAGKFLKDFDWIKNHWTKLKKIVLYREKHMWNKKYDLGVWTDSMESGADDNVALYGYPKLTVIGTDLNTFIYREYKAMSLLSEIIKKKKDFKFFQTRAEQVKKNIVKYLWDENDHIFYNIDTRTGEFIKRISYSSFIPLWEKLASLYQGKKMIEKYLLSPNHMLSNFGMRSLSKSDRDYNNRLIIKPVSNWQGPIWIIANYLYMHCLLNFGYQKEAIELAEKITKLVTDDIKTSGGMHENYNSETGKPLAADNFVSWNLLVGNMLNEAIMEKNPFIL